jgi:PKD repeat protein
MHTRTALAAALLAATGIGQVTIPPHSAIYNGFSRGFNFTAATNFIITQLNLPLDAFQAGDTASYLVRKNGAVTLHEVGNAGAIPTAIQVNTGDVIDVIGNWSPAAPGDFTAHNSYSSTAAPNTAPYATTIEGVAHTLNRTGWQWDIGVTPLTGVYLAPGAGQIGRVLMYTASSGLFAAFNATPRSGGSPLQVQFTDT